MKPFLLFTIALVAIICLALDVPAARADVTDQLRHLREQSVLLPGTEVKTVLAQEWLKYGPATLQRRDEALRRIRELGKRLADDQSAGRSRDCSAQIFLEAKWRALYTADFVAIDRRIHDLEKSFDKDDQTYATQQSPVEGSWGACFEPMFMKVEETMLSLQKMQEQNLAPKYRLKLAPEIQSGNDAIAFLSNLLISDIARNGIDHRSELASLTTDSGQFSLKDYWQGYLEDNVEGLVRDRDPGGIAEVRADFRRFLDAWQDPDSGYWGEWYQVGTQLYRTVDLSITFHFISYLQGDVHYWPQIIETTFKIENQPYPYGWRYGASSNNHNNYDVVKIFRYAWPHMTEEQRQRARSAMHRMLDWTLNQSLQADGSFASDENFFSSVASDYYFGISFLDEVGYWRAKKRFWTDETFADSRAACLLIRQRLAQLQLASPLALAAKGKLEASCGS